MKSEADVRTALGLQTAVVPHCQPAGSGVTQTSQFKYDRTGKMLIHGAVFLFVKYAAHLSAFLTKRVLKGAKFGPFCFLNRHKLSSHTSLLSFFFSRRHGLLLT